MGQVVALYMLVCLNTELKVSTCTSNHKLQEMKGPRLGPAEPPICPTQQWDKITNWWHCLMCQVFGGS